MPEADTTVEIGNICNDKIFNGSEMWEQWWGKYQYLSRPKQNFEKQKNVYSHLVRDAI